MSILTKIMQETEAEVDRLRRRCQAAEEKLEQLRNAPLAPPWLADAAEALGEVRPEDGAPLALNWTQVLTAICGLRDQQADLEIEKKSHEITRGMLTASAARIVSLSDTIRQREREYLEVCAELVAARSVSDESQIEAARLARVLAEANALLGRVAKYAHEDRAVTPGVTRLARVLEEIRVWNNKACAGTLR